MKQCEIANVRGDNKQIYVKIFLHFPGVIYCERKFRNVQFPSGDFSCHRTPPSFGQ